MKDRLVAASGDIFRKIVEDAEDLSIILLDDRGQVELWNSGAQRIFEWTAEEVAGRPFAFLFTEADRATGAPRRELDTARREGRADDSRWHLAKSGRLVFIDGLTMPFRDDDGNITGFSKFGRDNTERQLAERRIAAQLALTNLLNREEPLDSTSREIMRTICESLAWDIGALWQVRDQALVCIEHWHSSIIDDAAAGELCGGPLSRGIGLIGEVWERGEAIWVPDFGAAKYPRAPQAARAGVRSAFAFPIMSGGRFLGAMEFFSRSQREPEQALMPVMTLIGAQIGDYIERHRTTQIMRESEERFRLMTETAQDAIFTIDEQSTVTFCNPAVERMFGYTPAELVGKPLETIIPERLREAHRRGIARFLRTRVRNIPWTGVELPALHKDGHEFPCEISFGEWTSGTETIFTGLARDVTERKRAFEEEQRARAEAEAVRGQLERRADEEAAFRHLASALTGAVEMTDVLYEITNRATHVTRADGVYVERIVRAGNNALQVEVVAAAGRGAPPRGLCVAFPGSMTDEMLQNNQPVILADMKSFGRNMAPYLTDTCGDCEVLVTPLIADREPLGALVLLNSRSSGRHFGDGDVIRARTLGDLTSLALRRVRLMEEEREAKEKAEAAVRVRDETLGIVSHDLRNPLTKIALSADLLSEASEEEQPDLVETIRSSARQMERLIQDLLDVARMEAGNLSVARETIDTNALLHEICESHERIAAQKHQRIVCQAVGGVLPPVCGDHDRLMQVFGNLLGNAMKFTPERGAVTIEAHADGTFIRFVVRDSGPGIPEADLKKVFTPYWQAKKTAHMGAGLGLAIVRGIIEAHGGKVWGENAPGGGAMFSFTIPSA